MKNLFTLICFTVFSATLVLGQGSEGFDRFNEKSSDFYSGSFVGENGINWNFNQGNQFTFYNDQGLEKNALILKNDSASEVMSSVISGGIGLLKINYILFSQNNIKADVFINRTKVATINSNVYDDITMLSTGDIKVNIDKPFYIRIKQSDETSGQFIISKISWSKYAYEEYGNLTSEYISNNIKGSDKNTGILKDPLSPNYQIFPNPARDYVIIEMSEYHSVMFKLFTLAGQMVLQQQVKGSGQKININTLKEGLYIYKILDDKGKLLTGKMIKR